MALIVPLLTCIVLHNVESKVLTRMSMASADPVDGFIAGYNFDNGPELWGHFFPLCEGHRQSPVDLPSQNDVEVDEVNLPALLPNPGYAFRMLGSVSNTGLTLQVAPQNATEAATEGGPLKGRYVFRSVHFHWGSRDWLGSEHKIDGERFPLEMHLVHTNDKYEPSEATKHSDGLMVLGVLFELTETSNERFNDILTQVSLANTTSAGKFGLVKFAVGDLFLDKVDLDSYYTYNGSLTTPPCNPVVTWIVFKDPLKISTSQLEVLRSLKTKEESPLQNNFRPTQPLKGRKVLYVDSHDGDQQSKRSWRKMWRMAVEDFESLMSSHMVKWIIKQFKY